MKYLFKLLLLIAFVQNGASSFIRMNGSQVASGNIGANSLSSAIKIGCATAGTSCINANIGEVIIFNDALDSEGYKIIEKYLSNKWKIKIS